VKVVALVVVVRTEKRKWGSGEVGTCEVEKGREEK
jgi:hypothetical protein